MRGPRRLRRARRPLPARPGAQGAAHGLEPAPRRAARAGARRASPTATYVYFVHSYHPRARPTRRGRDHDVVRRRLRLQRRRATTSSPASSTPRRASASASACCAGSCGPSRPAHDRLPGHRPARRPLRAPHAGRLRPRDGLRRRPGRGGAALGGARARAGCTSSTSTARAPAARCRRDAGARPSAPPSASRCRSAAGCATRRRSRRCSPPARRAWCSAPSRCASPALCAALCRAHSRPGRGRHRRARRRGAVAGLARGRSRRRAGAGRDARRRWGAAAIVYTDIGRDGTQRGPGPRGHARRRARGRHPGDRLGRRRVARARARASRRSPTTASTGVIVGRALYTGAVDLARRAGRGGGRADAGAPHHPLPRRRRPAAS